MGVAVGVLLALLAGHSIAAIGAGLTIAQLITLGEFGVQAGVGIIKLDAAAIQYLRAHQVRHASKIGLRLEDRSVIRLCFQGAPSGQSARLCFE